MGFSKKWCMGLIPAVLASFAFMCSFLFSFWCESIKFTAVEESDATPDIQIGPWYTKGTQVTSAGQYYFVSDTCTQFPDGTEIDAKWKTVRAFSIIVLIPGGIFTFGLWLAPCLYFFSDSAWRCLAIQFSVFLTLFQGLTFLLFSSDACKDNSYVSGLDTLSLYNDTCEWDAGSTANACSTVLWFLTGLSMMWLGAPKRPPTPPAETQAVTYQQTQNPDGTTTVSEVNVVKGTAVPKEEPVSVPPAAAE